MKHYTSHYRHYICNSTHYISHYMHFSTVKLMHLFIAMITTLLLCACHHHTPEPTPNSTQSKRMTVITYIMAENSLSHFYGSDLNEMAAAAKSIPSDCNYVVYVDAENAPKIYTIDAKEGLVTRMETDECDSASPKTFRDVLSRIITLYPADNYGLIMWSHGSGWIPEYQSMQNSTSRGNKTIGVDNNINSKTLNTGSELDIIDMRLALEALNVHWDYIFFDACFMQCVELDYELHRLADYIIASPAEIPGEGAPYDKIMPYLVRKDNMSIEQSVQHIVSTYQDHYDKTDGVVLSAVRCSEMENLMQATRKILPHYYDDAYSFDTQDVQIYNLYSSRAYWRPEYYDMGNTMHSMMPSLDYDTWQEQLHKAVPFRSTCAFWYTMYNFDSRIKDIDNAAMMSIHIPNEKYDAHTTYNTAIKKTLWYKDYHAAQN